MASFLRIEINDRLRCQVGWQTQAIIRARDLAGPLREELSVEDPESLSVSVARYTPRRTVSPIVAAVRPQRVLCLVLRDSKTTCDYREYRLRGPIRDGRGERGVVTLVAHGLLLDLARCGPIVDETDGIPHLDFDLGDRTVAEILEDYVIARSGLPWLDLGDVAHATYRLPPSPLQNVTPMAVIDHVRRVLQERGLASERRFRRDGSAGYLLDLPEQIGGDVTTGHFTPQRGMPTLAHTVDPTEQATRVVPVLAADPDGVPGLIGRARWRVASVDAPNQRFVPEDPTGGASPIQFVGQYVQPTPWWIYRVRTGETWPLQASDPVAGFTVPRVGSLAAGEQI